MKTKREYTNLIIAARKAAGLTRSAAAEALNLGNSTLDKYETDSLRVNPTMASAMSDVYDDKALLLMYCRLECPIGEKRPACDCTRSLDSMMLDLLLTDPGKLRDVISELRELMIRGPHSLRDEERLGAYLSYLQHLCANTEGLVYAVMRYCAQSKRNTWNTKQQDRNRIDC